jgi:hypothetical protein
MTLRVEELGPVFWFLIPERQDSRLEFGHGEPHDARAVVELLQELERLAGGATGSIGRDRVQGVWQGIVDTSLRFEVAMPAEKKNELLEVLAKAAVTFGQECIYVVAEGRALLVYPGMNQ